MHFLYYFGTAHGRDAGFSMGHPWGHHDPCGLCLVGHHGMCGLWMCMNRMRHGFQLPAFKGVAVY